MQYQQKKYLSSIYPEERKVCQLHTKPRSVVDPTLGYEQKPILYESVRLTGLMPSIQRLVNSWAKA